MLDDKLKMVIVGAGRVGSTTAFAALALGTASEITLVDQSVERAEGEAMDLIHGMPYLSPAVIRAGDFTACRDADVVVITAGAAREPGDARLDLARRNLALFAELVPRIVEQTREAILVVVSNPVDVLTLATQRWSGLPAEQVLGSGTILDTSRLRSSLAQRFGVDARSVHAHVVGEHGDSQVTLWSEARVGGLDLETFARVMGKPWSAEIESSIHNDVMRAGAEVIKRKGATHYAIGLAAAHLVRTILRDERSILTVSTALTSPDALAGTALSLPCIVGRSGCIKRLELELPAHETAQLAASAAVLRDVYSKVNGPL
jgi:L-lactate dehydrogenase